MTTYKNPDDEGNEVRKRMHEGKRLSMERRNHKRSHEVALWSGVAAFFGSLLAIGIFDVFNANQWAEYLGALIVAAITAGGIYAKERLNEAKREEKAHGDT